MLCIRHEAWIVSSSRKTRGPKDLPWWCSTPSGQVLWSPALDTDDLLILQASKQVASHHCPTFSCTHYQQVVKLRIRGTDPSRSLCRQSFQGRGFPAEGGQRMRLPQRNNSLCGRLPVRAGGRGGHQYIPNPRPGPGWCGRPAHHQMAVARRWSHGGEGQPHPIYPQAPSYDQQPIEPICSSAIST